MKNFETLIDETLQAEDIEELEAAADLFQFGIEKGYYTKKQADEFNSTYWKVKNKWLAYEISENIKANMFDIMYIVANAPAGIKDDKDELFNYVSGRIKALKGKIGKLK